MNEHKLSLSAAVLLNMNILIGSGILIGPGLITAVAGNAGFLAWPVVAIAYLPLVISTAHLGRIFHEGGGFYAYAKASLGISAGFVSALLYVIGYTFGVAMELLALHSTLLTYMSDNSIFVNPILFNIVATICLLVLNAMTIKVISRFLGSLTITKILPLVILIILLPFIISWNFTISAQELYSLPNALPFAMFSFFGFEYCGSLAPLIKNNKVNGPRATFLAFLITAFLYTAFHFGLLCLMSSATLASLGASGGSAYAQYLNINIPFLKEFLQFLIPIASVLAIFATCAGLLNANILLLKSLADQKLFLGWTWVRKTNKNQRPWVALFMQGLLVLCITTPQLFNGAPANIDTIATLCIFSVLLAFVLPLISLLMIQLKEKSSHVVLTGLAIVIASGLTLYSFVQLGSSMQERLINLWPVVLFFVSCCILFILRKDDQKIIN